MSRASSEILKTSGFFLGGIIVLGFVFWLGISTFGWGQRHSSTGNQPVERSSQESTSRSKPADVGTIFSLSGSDDGYAWRRAGYALRMSLCQVLAQRMTATMGKGRTTGMDA